MKRCTRCKKSKNETEFYSDRSRGCGLDATCKECKKEIRELNKDINKSYRDSNKEKTNLKSFNHRRALAACKSYEIKLINLNEEYRINPNNEELLQVRCKNCNKWFTPTNKQISHKLEFLNGKVPYPSDFFCFRDCFLSFYNKIKLENSTTYKKYKNRVTANLENVYIEQFWWVNPDNLPRGRDINLFTIDHIFSVKHGFLNRVPIEVINNPFNLRMLPFTENAGKQERSDITLSELYEDYHLYLELKKRWKK